MSAIVVSPEQVAVVERQQRYAVRETIQSNTLIERRHTAVVLALSPRVQALMQPARSPVAVLSFGRQGPPGPAGAPGTGGGEEAMPYAKRTDFVSDTLIYKGSAVPGSADSAPVWRILRMTIAGDGDVTEQWAGGTADFDKVWNDRAALSYS